MSGDKSKCQAHMCMHQIAFCRILKFSPRCSWTLHPDTQWRNWVGRTSVRRPFPGRIWHVWSRRPTPCGPSEAEGWKKEGWTDFLGLKLPNPCRSLRTTQSVDVQDRFQQRWTGSPCRVPKSRQVEPAQTKWSIDKLRWSMSIACRQVGSILEARAQLMSIGWSPPSRSPHRPNCGVVAETRCLDRLHQASILAIVACSHFDLCNWDPCLSL